ncbi:macrolide transport system ATP-binding/permease protein [Variovorax boronicumulans]|uniref:macrolide ABC transporter ATP-binding protein/permease MacB n=1 Tax=Variovorax boronicumulans TaxID=436515 RepID=UPI002784AF49|nr:macrolide ABC transporter ATP-binding protein/permease MacB [Variovorax boronicumulans]MDP9995518.1 macrolide transport system ATP-binding/permease protein [Variovorax boronicumulans]MDQ0007239.1 macrolide transport system ATP-binding/permease protein [Variovorax boronicumulans]
MTEPLLKLRGIGRSFPSGEQEVQVLKDVDLDIGNGEMLAIVGASGSGKSTLMNILGCLDRPSSGTYTVSDQDVGTLDSDALAQLRREHFGFIFQRYHLMQHLTATGNVEVPAVYAGTEGAAREARARQLLARLGLEDRTEHRPSQLSGGQQQRVSIARALMNGGQVILADEPTGALDSKSGQEVIGILRELHAQGHTIIIVTHDMQVASCTERIIEIADGVIVGDRPNVPTVAAPAQTVGADASTPPAMTRPNLGIARFSTGWARFAEAFRMAWRSMMAHRMRTALTMLGIVIGITSVVSIVAIGEGAKRFVLSDIRAIGTNTLDVYPGRDFGDDKAASIRTLTPPDLQAIAAQPYVHSVTPTTMRGLRLRYRSADVNGNVNGVSDAFFRVRDIQMASGTAFTAEDVRHQSQVVVIDQNTRRKLFPDGTEPVGKVILVGNLPCTVIGVSQEKKSMFGENKSLNIWLPYSTGASRLFGQQHFDGITVRIRDDQPTKAAEDSIVRLLTMRHGSKDFFTFNMDSIVKTAERTSQSLTLLLSLIAVISLVVGGIGVMNIMLVSVTERTREIGIRMAVGARQSDVLQQFLTEAVLVCLVGGFIGVVLSYGISFLFSLFVTQWQMIFSMGAVVAAFLCASLIGVLFGYLPARNAARLDPIEALARE